MTDITSLDRTMLPSTRRLLKATGMALLVAAVILVTAVLPAEYGIDPTGVGRRLGLATLSAGASTKPPSITATESGEPLSLPAVSALNAVWKAPAAYRTDELTLTLKPAEGAEIKADMKTGDRFMFTWTVEGGAVTFDMHGEKLDAASDDFSSYWKGRTSAGGHGEFQAPFSGTHGWYWENRGDKPVTVKVKTSGFYEKLYQP